jgi:hypothetical protein
MADIEKSFAFLQDNIPPWSETLNQIEEKIAHMRSEMARVPAQMSAPMRRKTGSMESIRDMDGILDDPQRTTPAQPSQPASQKRKPASIVSGASVPVKSRARAMMIIVYYDGQVQKQFETLFRNIGTGRNLLRKGKMAARAQALAELAGSEDEDSEGDDDSDNIMSKIQYRRRTGLTSMRSRPAMRGGLDSHTGSTSTPESLFETVDKSLEQAQALCERAAHQSLREGDCRKELDGMRKYLDEVLETTKKEVAKHNVRKEEEAAQEAQKESKADIPAPTSSPTPQTVRVRLELKPTRPVIRPVPTVPLMSKDLKIEIDDDDEDDVDFVMPPIRLTSRT